MDDVANLDEKFQGMETSQEVTGWRIKTLPNKVRKEAYGD